jgi:hypothetical protein
VGTSIRAIGWDRRAAWIGGIAALALIRLSIPLVALAAQDVGLPWQPRWEYRPFEGDANGYHAAAREAIAAAARVPAPLVLLAAGLLAGAVLAALRLRRAGEGVRWLALALPAAAVSLAATLVVREMEPPGSAVVGWSLLWGAVLAPVRAVAEPGVDVAFAAGLVLSLASLAVATVATAYVGLYATGRRSVGLAAAALFACWPLATGLLVGERAWENGSWTIDVGLALYTEPVSTALVVTALALLLRPGTLAHTLPIAAAGLAVGYATVVKLSNGVVGAVLALLVLAGVGRRAFAAFAVSGLVWAPLLLAYWPKGYVELFHGETSAHEHPWALAYVDDAWTDSSLFTPRLLLLLAPLALLGCVAVRDRLSLAILATPVVVNAVVYSFYDVTKLHPRFLYGALPSLFVLEAAGGVLVVTRVAGLVRRRRAFEFR